MKNENNAGKVVGVSDIQVKRVPDDMSFNTKFGITDFSGDKGIVCKVIPDDQMPKHEDGTNADILVRKDRVTEEDFKKFNIGRDVSYENAVAKGISLSRADWLYVKYAYACATTTKFGKGAVIDFTDLIVDQNDFFDYGPEVK